MFILSGRKFSGTIHERNYEYNKVYRKATFWVWLTENYRSKKI